MRSLVLYFLFAVCTAGAQDTALIRKNHVKSVIKKEWRMTNGTAEGFPYFTETYYNKNAQPESVLYYFEKDKPQQKYVYRYDANGEHLYDLSCNMTIGIVDTITEEDNAKKQYGDKWQEYKEYIKLEKDEKGRIVRQVFNDYRGMEKRHSVFKYDALGHMISWETFDPRGKRIGSEEWMYSASGKLLSQVSKNERGIVTSFEKRYYDKYDSLELKIDSLGYPLGTKYESATKYKYGMKHGKWLPLMEEEHKKGSEPNIKVFTYAFDPDSSYRVTQKAYRGKVRPGHLINTVNFYYDTNGILFFVSDFAKGDSVRTWYDQGQTARCEYSGPDSYRFKDLFENGRPVLTLEIDSKGDTIRVTKTEYSLDGLVKRYNEKIRSEIMNGDKRNKISEIEISEGITEYAYTYY
ncbi:MAG TPA: hypothetical protein VI112_08415 [Bacteroidia bacterium]